MFSNLDIDENIWYQCNFIEGNDAWIAKDKEGFIDTFQRQGKAAVR